MMMMVVMMIVMMMVVMLRMMMVMRMMMAMKIIPNIEMFLPHSISNRSTQVLGRGMDTHLRKHWIFVFPDWITFPQKEDIFAIFLLNTA